MPFEMLATHRAPRTRRMLAVSVAALAVAGLGACGSSSGSDGSGATTTAAASSSSTADAAFVKKVDAACADIETEVDASNEAAKTAPDTEVQGLEQKALESAVTQFQTLSTTAQGAGGTSDDAKAFVAVIAKLPSGYTALATASEQLVTNTDLASDPSKADEVEKAIEGPTNTLLDELEKGKKLAGELGLTSCTAMFDAIGPTE